MPSPTFLKLPAEKRDRIVELALEEFSERPYAQASLSRIVARAGIAKGSMYQYFADKLDLYRWLVLEEVGRRKQAFVGPAMTADTGLRGQLRAGCLAALQFALTHPRLARLAAHALEPSAEPGLRALHAEMRAIGLRGVEAMLVRAQAAGEVREDLAPGPTAAVLAAALGPGLMDALLARLGVDTVDFLKDTTLAARLAPCEAEGLVDGVLDALWGGLAPRPGAGG